MRIARAAALERREEGRMRRLPVFLLLDTSGSMKGEPLQSVRVGLETMLASLRKDPFALESVYLCLITFDREARVLVPFTALEDFILPEITVPDSGPTHTGRALQLLCREADASLRKNSPTCKGDWKPLLFLLTDGKPSDTSLYAEQCEAVKSRDFARIVPCAAGIKAKMEPLKLLADEVYILQNMDESDFRKFFLWVSDSIACGNRSIGLPGDMRLPPPPEEVAVIC